jgi:hypothetical protein
MPIRPENKARYPANWQEIRQHIRERSGDKCEWCGVHNGAIGYRLEDGTFIRAWKNGDMIGRKLIKIVLTVAHVHDHNPENCADDNLAHLCQRCHNRHDAPMRHAGRKQRAELESGQSALQF